MRFMGVDPGQSGGVALVGQEPSAWGLKGMTEADISVMFEAVVRVGNVQMAVIERVWAMPKQGVSSSFKFGVSYGFLRGMLIAHRIPFEEVTPAKWQKFLGCLTGGDKNVSKAKAQQLFPELKITHAVADALLIAEYARRTSVQQKGSS